MISYIVRRLSQALLTLLLVSILIFLAMRFLPGDPILMYMGQDTVNHMSIEQVEAMRHEFGLDKSLPSQYVSWISGVVRGDFGVSIAFGEPVTDIIIKRVPISLYLGSLTFIIFNLIGIPAGVICAIRRGKWLDTIITVLANIGITIPVFWLGILLIYLFGLYLNWLPIYGYTSPFTDFWLSSRQIIMPVICMCVLPIASTARQARSSMLEVMQQDYIRTAWSKGLRERLIVMRHALKNGLIPVVTLTGLGISNIVAGSVLVETVFNIPGMGRLAVTSVINQDYPVVQAVVLFISTVVVLANLTVDLSYGWLDPRVQYNK
jgi:peptide/nickel transport system permease protein